MNRDGFENSSFNLKSKYQFQEFVLPHKVAILVLIKAFCEVKGKSRNADEIIDESWVQTSQQLRNFSITLLKLIQGPAIDLKDLDSLIKPILLPKTYELFINRLNELKEGGIAILMDFIQSLEILMIDPQFPIPLVHKSSITGLYLRKIMLAFDKLTFSQVTQLFKQYLQYFDKSGINADDNVEEDSIMELMSRKSEHVDHYWELSKTQVTSKKQVELFIGQQAALLQTNEAEAIPPKKLQEKLVHLLQSTPDLAEAQYLSFLNCMRVQEMVGATHSLYHCFDCSMLYSPSENKSGSPVNMFGEANSRSARYAALNLAALQAHFGHKEEAMSALKEAITVAHEANDNACLQHILMRLIRLESDNKEALLERFILRTGEIGIPFLGSLGMLTFAQCKALNGSQPSKVFDSMIKSDIVICQHSMLDLMTNSYGQKAALWDMYGKTLMSSLTNQLLLNLNTSEASCKGVYHCNETICKVLCCTAMDFFKQGYPELSNDLILYAESLFPLHSIYSKEWMTCKQLIIYIRATWNGRLDDANEALKSMIVVDKCESAYREAELLFLKGEILKSSTEVDKLISNRGQYTDHFHTRTLLLKVELLCHCGNFSQAISIITECLTLCQKKFLTYLEAISKLYIANIQIHRKIHGQTTYVLNQAVLYILSCGSCYDQGIVYYLMAKCIFMNNSKIEDEVNGKKEILKAIEHMEKSAKIFKNIEAMQRFKNCMYWLSFLYHKVGDKIERNRCAKEFRELDSKQDIRLGIFTGLL
ncbi:Anaphase-promoting complex subunit 5 [Nymphon striatum]|nr:Anaphase-promoting complex subunit 5 [Nymphon striatum]